MAQRKLTSKFGRGLHNQKTEAVNYKQTSFKRWQVGHLNMLETAYNKTYHQITDCPSLKLGSINWLDNHELSIIEFHKFITDKVTERLLWKLYPIDC